MIIKQWGLPLFLNSRKGVEVPRRRRVSTFSRERLSPTVAAVLLLSCCLCSGFNLESQAPIVKKAFAPGGYFGFSVAEHGTSDGQSYMLVGAPLAENSQPGTSQSGSLWKCPLTNFVRDCEEIVTDGKRYNDSQSPKYGRYDSRNVQGLNAPVSWEIKNGQWLGVEVKSQGKGGKVIVCAHRYTVRNVQDSWRKRYKPVDSDRGILGMCYVLESDLKLPYTERLDKSVLVIKNDNALKGSQFKPAGQFSDHLKWGACQLGASVAWVGGSRDQALLGAPGCFTWRGNVQTQTFSQIGFTASEALTEDTGPTEYERHGYLGLSVSSGNFFGEEVVFVSGAPHTGRVYFFDNGIRDTPIRRDFRLEGESFGSGFGYSLASLDLNSDGRSDLAVGAPFSESESDRGGAVYVYLGGDSDRLDGARNITLVGRGRDSQFGISMANIGDLNLDGFEDLAVGAPYEEGGGKVYVFFGGRLGLTSVLELPQRLYAEEAAVQILSGSAAPYPEPGLFSGTFGYSISGGLDLDKNGYPDLLVGAYQSDAVFLFRARPIIDIKTSVTRELLIGIDPGKKGCADDPESSDSCFGFDACFLIKKSGIFSLLIKFTIEGDVKKSLPRIRLKLPDKSLKKNEQSKSNVVSAFLPLSTNSKKEICSRVIGYVRDTIKDIQSEIFFKMSYELVQETPSVNFNSRNILDINKFPILNQAQAKKNFFGTFQKNCGEDDVCESRLYLEPSLYGREKELARTENNFYELELGNLGAENEVILQIIVSNEGEGAYNAGLDIHFPSSLSFVGLGEAGKQFFCTLHVTNKTLIQCDLGNPFKGSTPNAGKNTEKLTLRFSPKKVVEEKQIQFVISCNTTSSQAFDTTRTIDVLVVKRAEVKITGIGAPETLYFGGAVRGESAMNHLSEIGPAVTHIYQVTNEGPSQVTLVQLEIEWPIQVENGKEQGKWLLYLAEFPTIETFGHATGQCKPVSYAPNPLNLTSKNGKAPDSGDGPQGGVGRRRREVERVIVPQEILDRNGDVRSVVTLGCNRGTSKCLRIECQVWELPPGATVTVRIRARLWNATLVEDYDSVDAVVVYSAAHVRVGADVTQDQGDDYSYIETTCLPDVNKGEQDVIDWWIIVVSVLAGLLVLVIIILILWKLGFFERKRPLDDENYMLSANFQKVHF